MTDHKTWPASSRKELLRATFSAGNEGSRAFETWKSQIDMADHPDFGSFRLLPILFRQLRTNGVDDPIMMKLKGIVRQNWYKNQRFFYHIEPLLQALHEAGLECLLLYGAAFASNYNRDYVLGTEMNLSILVSLEQVRPAIEKLQDLGWQPENQLWEPLLEPFLAANWMQTFQDATGRKINLNWHLLPECRTVEAGNDFWDKAITTTIHDVPVRVLNPADQLLHCCVADHSSNELSNFLRAIDIMLIIKATPDLDWDRLISQAEKYHLVVPLLTVLGNIQDTLKDPLPPVVWLRLRSLPISWQERLEYRLRTSHPILWRRFWQQWFNYLRHTEGVSLAQGLLGFPQYLQHFWRLPALRQVPRQTIAILRQHLHRRFSLFRRVV